MADDKYCGDCGSELELLTGLTTVNSTESVGGHYLCKNCGDEMVIVEHGGREVVRAPLSL